MYTTKMKDKTHTCCKKKFSKAKILDKLLNYSRIFEMFKITIAFT